MERARVAFLVPKESDIPKNEFGDVVRLGETDIRAPQGPLRPPMSVFYLLQQLPPDVGRKVGSAPLWAAYVAYPEYRAKNKKVKATFEERLQGT